MPSAAMALSLLSHTVLVGIGAKGAVGSSTADIFIAIFVVGVFVVGTVYFYRAQRRPRLSKDVAARKAAARVAASKKSN